MDSEDLAYSVEPEGETGRFRVINDDGRTVCVCAGQENAEHYATLLNEAYARGLRRGRRESRRSS